MKAASSRPLRRFSAFTLVEILSAVGIIAVLATLGLSAYMRTLDRAREARCASNLRLIGVGIAAYTGENNNVLPGPLLPSQGPRYNKVDGQVAAYLASFLAPYLDIPEAASGGLPTLAEARNRAPMFYCPSFASAARNNFANSYFMRWKIAEMGTSKPPWGNYGTSTPQLPWNVLTIPDPAKTWAVTDVDKQCPDLPAQSWVNDAPSLPVHGRTRNALFFDGHVGKISPSGDPL